MTKTKVSFFGASVTQQKEGYVKVFRELCPDTEVETHAYGSMHINDAGMCFMKNVAKGFPQFCFIDWFSTGYVSKTITIFLNSLVHTFYSVRCVLVFLLLERRVITKEVLEYYEFVKQYAGKMNIPVIQLYGVKEPSSILRDSIHTSQEGSLFYGTQIADVYKNILMEKYPISHIKLHSLVPIPMKTEYCNIQTIHVNKIIYDKLELSGTGKLMGLHIKVGPYSGIVNFNGTTYNLWDVWCYYVRESVKLAHIKINNGATLEITNDTFDRSEAKQQPPWDKFKKCVKLIRIYYIGNISIITDLHSLENI